MSAEKLERIRQALREKGMTSRERTINEALRTHTDPIPERAWEGGRKGLEKRYSLRKSA